MVHSAFSRSFRIVGRGAECAGREDSASHFNGIEATAESALGRVERRPRCSVEETLVALADLADSDVN